MIDGLIVGKLHGAPDLRNDKNGKPFAVGKVLATPSDGDQLIVNVIVFDADARTALMALEDGDSVALAGSLTPKVWTDKQGNTRPALDMIAQQVMTTYHARSKQLAMSPDGP
jgi:single-stranded DNA-binding protein